MVSKRSETREGAAGRAWHVGQEEGTGKQGLSPSLRLSPSLLPRHQVGRANTVHLEEGRKAGRIGRRSCARQSNLTWRNSQQPCPAAPTCREPGAKCPALLLAGPRQVDSHCSCRWSMHARLCGGSQGFHPGVALRNTTETNSSL